MRERHGFSRTLLAGGVALAVLTSAGGAVAAATGEAPTVSEIVVTAQKRVERLQTVADAVTAVPAAELSASGGSGSARDLVGLAPGLTVGDGIGSGNFVIRGLSTGSDTSPVVGMQIDGAPIGPVAAGAQSAFLVPEIDPSDISRVEVLRGPQGTLYGGSTLGGIVNYVTVRPGLTHSSGTLYLEGSDVDHGGGDFVARGQFSAPLIQDKLGFSLSAFIDDLGGYIDDPTLGRSRFDDHHSWGGRAAVLWQVNPDFQIELSDTYSHLDSRPDQVIYNPATSAPVAGDLVYASPVLPLYDLRANIVMLDAAYDLHWASLNYIGTYQTTNASFVNDYSQSAFAGLASAALPLFGGITLPANTALGVAVANDSTKITQEVRLTSPDEGRIRWLAGFFFNHEQDSLPEVISAYQADQSIAAGPGANVITYDLFTHLTEIAGFGDVTVYLTPRLDITGGVRVGHIAQDYEQLYSGSDAAAFNALFVAFGFLPTPADTGVRSSSDTFETYLASLRYRLSPNDMVYFRFATGFRPGGPNASVPGIPPTFGPDTTQDFELGWKTSAWNDRAYLELVLYDVEWANIQLLTVSHGLSGEANGGHARSRGVEATFNSQPIQGLTLAASAAYSDAKLAEDFPGGLGLAGDSLPNAPKWMASASVEYEWPLAAAWDGFAGGDVRYMGERFANPQHSLDFREYVLPAYTTVDLRIGVRHGGAEFTVFARNVGDARPQDGVYQAGADYVVVGRPRTLGASLDLKF